MPADESRRVQTGVRSVLEWILDAIMVAVLIGAAIGTQREFVRALVVVAIALILFSCFLRLRRWFSRKPAHSLDEPG